MVRAKTRYIRSRCRKRCRWGGGGVGEGDLERKVFFCFKWRQRSPITAVPSMGARPGIYMGNMSIS